MKIFKEIKPGSMRETVDMALPMIVSSACDTLMIFIDRVFLSKVSTHNMNASMLGGLSIATSQKLFKKICRKLKKMEIFLFFVAKL
jgi:Na+-driven multidrug efflux pump